MGRTIKVFSLLGCVMALGLTATPATAKGWQCVTYARTITDVFIRGNANTWWGQAEGRYDRGITPAAGAVLAFKSAPGMPMGHVAVVKDIVSAILHVTLTKEITGVFNAGCGGALTINALARRIIAAANSRSEIQYLPDRPGDVKHSRADIQKLLATGWKPAGTLEEGLREMM